MQDQQPAATFEMCKGVMSGGQVEKWGRTPTRSRGPVGWTRLSQEP